MGPSCLDKGRSSLSAGLGRPMAPSCLDMEQFTISAYLLFYWQPRCSHFECDDLDSVVLLFFPACFTDMEGMHVQWNALPSK